MHWLRQILNRTPAPELDSAAAWSEAEGRLPFLDRLTPEARGRLRILAIEFLATKEFFGAEGFSVSNAMRLEIALQACLPVLEFGLDAYRDWVGIVVYQGEFVARRRILDEDGIEHEYDETAMGEASNFGPVVLGWFDDFAEADGANVVIHEFAHKLDMLNGDADGCPPLHRGMSLDSWIEAFDLAFNDFCARVDAGEDTWIDPYASEDPAEFFAVCSEVFFTGSEVLKREYPEVYQQLALFYKQDPAKQDA
ncbi:zinc-dependent peptidase [Niveibacterium sp. 24ML]|uniref:M90 family metallopeptidase n=1 Tax=Niveibacterium sp. 24ML TaxID=2985512 RepID=UPI00226DF28E|nr:M90 family metallopeptidase [Niveibacterium sp. 24ML]MCX9156706.1 zinc-dependent peptidase [Niveibacterium sp. 24ML]